MKIKRYVADDMAQACELIKSDLGPEALILSTQRVRGSGFGLRRRPQIEIVAGLADGEEEATGATAGSPPLAESLLAHQRVLGAAEDAATAQISAAGAARAAGAAEPRAAASPPIASPSAAAARGERDTLLRLERHLLELREAVDRLGRPKASALLLNLSEPLRALYQRLREQELPEELITAVLGELRQTLKPDEFNDEQAIEAGAAERIAARVPEARELQVAPGRTGVVFFVGPTGSGKTTSMVKLAARLGRDNRSVLLVTTDVGRAGAVQQLGAYADALALPTEIAYGPGDLRALIAGASNYDVVLVDTAGSSPENAVRLAEIRSMLATVRRKDVYLTLNATAKLSDLRRACERFELTPITGIVLTRLDETLTVGPLLALLAGSRAPLAFLGNGQDILSDLRGPEIRELADAVAGHEREDGGGSERESTSTVLAMGA